MIKFLQAIFSKATVTETAPAKKTRNVHTRYVLLASTSADQVDATLTVLRKQGILCRTRKGRKPDLVHIKVNSRQRNRALKILGA